MKKTNVVPCCIAPDRYLITPTGEVFGLINTQGNRLKEPVRLTPYKDKDGYLSVSLRSERGGYSRRYKLHRLVCETFHGPRPSSSHECGHNDGNPENNVSSNLRWVTRKENMKDREKHGKTVWGERATRGKLTEDAVRAARILYKNEFSLERIALLMGVSPQAIHAIVTGKTWQRLPHG